MTYSIIARCPRTGQFGFAVATYSPSAGARCPAVVPGRGAASVQAVTNPMLQQHAGRLLAEGRSARNVIEELQAMDPHPQTRQILAVDVYGSAHAITGDRNRSWAGHHVGDGYACAGNVLSGSAVVQEMARAYEGSPGEPLAERLMRAIEAGRDAGGQPEGQNSAAMLVVDAHPAPIVDLRVDLHDAPEAELRRLWDWYRPMVPYYVERALRPDMPPWWQWRMATVPGWRARHLG